MKKFLIIFLCVCLGFLSFDFIQLYAIEKDYYVDESSYVDDGVDFKEDPMNRTNKNINFTRAVSDGTPYWKGKDFYNGKNELMYGGNSKFIIDVSEHNGMIDWKKVKESGVDGAILRLGWGKGHEDLYFKRNITECNRLGIPYGLYIYSYAYDANYAFGEAQGTADILDQYDLKNLQYPIYYDLEAFKPYTLDGITYYPPTSPTIYESIVKTFVNQLSERGYTSSVHVYSYRYYCETALDSPYILSRTSWIAEYGPTLQFDNTYYDGASGWQYTSSGRVNGISGNVDLNVFSDIVKTRVESIELNQSSLNLKKSYTYKLQAKLAPSYALNQKIKWVSSDESVAIVNSNGVVTALNEGTATIKASTLDGSRLADTCIVKVGKINAPQNLEAKMITSDQIKCDWDASSDATYYQLYMSTSENGTYQKVGTYSSKTTSATIKNLSCFTNYYFKVRCYRKNGDVIAFSPYSDVVKCRTNLSIPKNYVVKRNSSTSIKLSWNSVVGASSYQIYRSLSPNGKYSRIASVKGTSYIQNKLATNQTYYYKVRCVGTYKGDTKYSAFTNVKSAKPTLLKTNISNISKTSNKISLKWEPIEGAYYYQVYCKVGNNKSFVKVKTLKKDQLTYVHTNRKKNVKYEYKVRGYKMVNGKKVFSPFSTTKSMKIS